MRLDSEFRDPNTVRYGLGIRKAFPEGRFHLPPSAWSFELILLVHAGAS